MSAFEKRKAFPTALRYLAEAEKIDGLNPDVRKARLRITCANFYKQVQQRPVCSVADKTLAAIGEMPQTLQGDRPAFVQAVRYILALCKGDLLGAEIHRAEMERFLESATAAAFLTIAVAHACNFSIIKKPELLPKYERDGLPAKLARIAALAADLNLAMKVPRDWLAEARTQFAGVSKGLDLLQLRNLGECALFNENIEFAYDISVEDLPRFQHRSRISPSPSPSPAHSQPGASYLDLAFPLPSEKADVRYAVDGVRCWMYAWLYACYGVPKEPVSNFGEGREG